jgi:hypothetical protein
VILLAFFKTTPTFLGGGEYLYVSFFENWEISNNELNVLKLEFEVNNIMDNKTSHNSLLNLIFIIFKGPFSCPFSP